MERGLQALNRKQKVAVWSERISACRSSGQTVSSWCAENGVCPGSYYKWQKQIYELATVEAPKFVEVEQPKSWNATVAVLHMGGAEVELKEGIDEKTLETICRCLGSC